MTDPIDQVLAGLPPAAPRDHKPAVPKPAAPQPALQRSMVPKLDLHTYQPNQCAIEEALLRAPEPRHGRQQQ